MFEFTDGFADRGLSYGFNFTEVNYFSFFIILSSLFLYLIRMNWFVRFDL